MITMAEVSPAGTEARARVEALFRALNEHDLDKLIDMHTVDALWDDPELAEPVRGRAAIAVRAAAMFRAFPDLQFPLDELEIYRAESGRVAARWHAVGTMTGPIDPPGFAPTGKKVSLRGACFYEFEDGKLASHTIVYDTMGMLRQAGVMPMPESPQAKLMAGLQRTAARAAARRPRRR
jgi:steroid delta-isomerase-like uncharacterized protein